MQLRKEKDMLRDSQTQSFELIRVISYYLGCFLELMNMQIEPMVGYL